ncbi:DUF6734 family protein [Mucilaginibacter sp. L196]|uniref:DUF6734 family protein n=1 Tax=Mucilaginibacter sp. L196 TaxID=1641870 RepID=UPI00131CAAD2|nr:DUF6734 family protein [Mucilaginibacter sp. L196]
MKIIQTSWACTQDNLLKFNAGWYAPEYNLMSWALSCLQLKKYYKDVSLYADNVSARMLIDTLQLPYTELICDLDKLNNIHPKLWALPKIDTYSRQDRPFLHVDGDVFIWKSFDDQLLNAGLISQNLEVSTEYYETNFQKLEKTLMYFPPEIIEARKKYNPIYAYNAGIFGGHDIPFFKDYTKKSLEFIKKSEGHLPNIDVNVFNIFFEQYLFYALVKKHQKKVSVMLDEVIGDNQYTGFGEFCEVPHNKQYLHLLGTFKRDRVSCEQMANRLKLDYPEYYYRIVSLFKKGNIPLRKNYYHFVNETCETLLTDRYKLLKTKPEHNNILNSAPEKQTATNSNIATNAYVIVLNAAGVPYDESFVAELKQDINAFEVKLDEILNHKFISYSKEYLYARDIKHTPYYQLIFEDTCTGFNTKLIADSLLEIIEHKYNWYEVYESFFSEKYVKPTLNIEPSANHTCVIPECDNTGYSLVNADDLDLLILQCLKNPTSIIELLNEVKSYFDPADLEDSAAQFELLITGRIKSAIHSKTIKVAGNQTAQ